MCPKGFARLYLSKAEGEESCEFYHGFGGGGGETTGAINSDI